MEIQWIWPTTHYLLIHSVSQSTFAYTKLHMKLQSQQLKRTPQDCINELIIWKMNPLVVATTSLEFKFAFLHA